MSSVHECSVCILYYSCAIIDVLLKPRICFNAFIKIESGVTASQTTCIKKEWSWGLNLCIWLPWVQKDDTNTKIQPPVFGAPPPHITPNALPVNANLWFKDRLILQETCHYNYFQPCRKISPQKLIPVNIYKIKLKWVCVQHQKTSKLEIQNS